MNPHAMLRDPEAVKNVESLKRVDADGYLYSMDCTWNYYDLPKEAVAMFDAGCSAFFTKNLDGDHVLCRNYDYGHRPGNVKKEKITGCNVVVRCMNPVARYRSVGVADAFWLDYRNARIIAGVPDDGKTDLSWFSILPYLCMDGVNEAGLCVTILALPLESDWEEIPFENWESRKKKPDDDIYELTEAGMLPDPKYMRAVDGTIAVNAADKRAWIAHQTMYVQKKPGCQTVLHPMLMRYMLDKCGSVDEAVGLAQMFNVKATVPGSTYHVLLGDRTGKSVLLEWVGDEVKVIDICHATNFFVSREDRFGGGLERDALIESVLGRYKKGLREDLAVHALALAAQAPDNGADRGKTQYSCIYNAERGTMRVFSFGDFTKSWEFSIN